MASEDRAVPFIVYEGAMARAERAIRRLTIALVMVVLLLFASNVMWLAYESQFETIYYEQDGAGINNVNTGTQGSVLNEPEGQGTT